jgi:hypothetical protein
MKIWLGGLTNSIDVIPLIEKSLPYFDGIVFTLDEKSDKSLFDKFEELKKANDKFHYIVRPFAQAHDWRANDWLHSGLIKSGDYVCVMDSTDRFNDDFLINLKATVNQWNETHVNSIFLDRLFMFKFTGHQYFESTPHWGVSNILNKIINLTSDPSYKRENYIINTREVLRYGIIHPIKYFCEYKRSNATQLLYQQFGNNIWQYHENQRLTFQIFVEQELGFECTVQNLINYISEGIKNKNLPEYIINYIQLEVNMQDLVRFYILKQDFLNEIAVNRFNWSFRKFYYNNEISQGKDDGFVGLFNQYRLKQNRGME